jgi:hypothetical protein
VLRALLDRDQPVRPLPGPARGLDAHRGGEQRRRLPRQRPQPRTVDGHQAAVVDHLPGEQRAHHVDAFAQARVADGLGRPRRARDVLVGELARAERHREPSREQLAQRRGGLRHDRRVVALARGVDDPEGERGRLHRGAQPRPREPGLALARAPGREVVRRPRGLEARRLGVAHRRQQRARRELLV